MRNELIWGIGFVLFLNAIFKGGEGEILQTISPLLFLILLFFFSFNTFKGGEEFVFIKSPIHLPLLLLSLSLLTSTFFSQSRGNSLRGIPLELSYLASAFLGTQILPFNRNTQRIGVLLLLLALTEALFGIGQRLFLGVERVTGTLDYATFFIDPLLVGINLHLGYLLFDSLRKWQRVFLWATFPLYLLALLWSGTRALLPSLLSIFLFMGILKGRRIIALLTLLAFLFLLLFFLFPNSLRDRLFHGERNIYSFQRVKIWWASLQVFLDHPFIGVGLKNFEFISPPYNFPVEGAVGRYARKVEIPHNQYLDIACHSGLPGILSFLLLITIGLKTGIRSLQKGGIYWGALAGFISLLVHFIFDNPLYLPLNGFIFYLLLGLLGSGPNDSKNQVIIRLGRIHPVKIRIYLSLFFLPIAYHLAEPLVANFFYQKGVEEAMRKNYSQAIRSCRMASALLPSEAIYHNALGTLYGKAFEKNRNSLHLQMARIEHKRGIDSHPIDPFYREDFANLLFNHREEFSRLGIEVTGEIFQQFQAAIHLDPYNPFYRRKLAALHADFGEKERGIQILEETLKIEPYFLFARYQLILLYQELGKEENSRLHYQVLLSHLNQTPPLRANSPYENDLIDFDKELLKTLPF